MDKVQIQLGQIINGQQAINEGINRLLELHLEDKYKYDTAAVLNMVEAAHLLNVSQATLLEACLNRELPCRKIGSTYIFVRDTLITWLNLDEPKVDIKDSIDSEIAAELLGISVAKIREWSKGYHISKIPVIREGNKFFYDKDQLLEWMQTPEFMKLKDEYIRNRSLNEQRRKEAAERYEAERLEKEAQKKARLEKKLTSCKVERINHN